VRFDDAGFDILRSGGRRPGSRIGPLRRGYGTPPVVITAAGIVNGALTGFRARTVALMSRHAKAAGMGRSSRHRQRERSKGSDKREQQQESGG
jgi:hypothetical protein